MGRQGKERCTRNVRQPALVCLRWVGWDHSRLTPSLYSAAPLGKINGAQHQLPLCAMCHKTLDLNQEPWHTCSAMPGCLQDDRSVACTLTAAAAA
eukprot:242424-Chlamydomonas_euryale.AAC.10